MSRVEVPATLWREGGSVARLPGTRPSLATGSAGARRVRPKQSRALCYGVQHHSWGESPRTVRPVLAASRLQCRCMKPPERRGSRHNAPSAHATWPRTVVMGTSSHMPSSAANFCQRCRMSAANASRCWLLLCSMSSANGVL